MSVLVGPVGDENVGAGAGEGIEETGEGDRAGCAEAEAAEAEAATTAPTAPTIPKETVVVPTDFGRITVTIEGDRTKSHGCIVTVPDLCTNHTLCYKEMMRAARDAGDAANEGLAATLSSSFCVYHVDLPGHEAGAPEMSEGSQYPTQER